MRLGMGEMLIILVVVLLVFGAQKLPQLGDALGKGIRNFKKAANELNSDVDVTPAQRAEAPRLPAAVQAQAPVAQATEAHPAS